MRIERLNQRHDRKSFDCGNQELNQFLQQTALQAARRALSVTRVLVDTERAYRVIGYYTVLPASVGLEDLPEPARKKMPRTVLVVRLGRLAVDAGHQGNGYGTDLLIDACLQLDLVANTAGAVGLVVDAKAGADGFYGGFGFVPAHASGAATTLFLPTEQARCWLRKFELISDG